MTGPVAKDVCAPSGFKWAFLTSKDAKNHARAHDLHGLSAYRCDNCGYVHLGHLPTAVKQGRLARAQIGRRP